MGRRKRGWNVAAGLSLDDLRRLCEEKEAQLDRLASHREDLLAQLSDVDAQIGGGGGGGGKKRGRKPGRRRGPGRPPKAGRKAKARGGRRGKRKAGGRRGGARGPRGEGGLQNMIRGALGKSSEPMKLADLAQAVLDSGYETSSSRFPVIVGQRLSEMKDVKKAGRGMYVLK